MKTNVRTIKSVRNNEVRERINAFMNHYGSSVKFIANKSGLDVSNLNMFVLGHRDISEGSLIKIERFINDRTAGVRI